jgi:hypothetical protein
MIPAIVWCVRYENERFVEASRSGKVTANITILGLFVSRIRTLREITKVAGVYRVDAKCQNFLIVMERFVLFVRIEREKWVEKMCTKE